MRVLLVNDFYTPHAPGGAETLVRSLAHTLAARGHTVAVCTARIGDLPAQSVDESGIKIYRIGRFPAFRRSLAIASGTAPSRPSRETVADMERVFDTFQPHTIHFHNVWLLGPSLINMAARRGHTGVTLHDYWPVCVRRSMIRVNWQPCDGPEPLNCRLCRLRGPSTWRSLDILGIEQEMAEHAVSLGECNFVTAPSAFVAERVSKGIGRQVTVVPNGVNIPSTPETSPASTLGIEGPYVLFASRTTVEKGYEVAIKAFGSPILTGYTLVVAGDAPTPNSPNNNVRILGKQPASNMLTLMAGAQCVIVPSLWPEPFGLALVEAMLHGVPVVATRMGAIPEIVDDGVTGILIEPTDVDALANAIVRACTDPTLRANARQHGPAAVHARYSIDIMAAQLEELYAA